MEKRHIINFIALFTFLGLLIYGMFSWFFISQTKEFTIQDTSKSQTFELSKDFVSDAVDIEVYGELCNDAKLICAERCLNPPSSLACNEAGVSILDTLQLPSGNTNRNIRYDIYSEPAMVFYYLPNGNTQCSGKLTIRATFVGHRL